MAGELETLLEEWAERRQVEAPQSRSDGKHFFVFDGEFEVAASQLGPSIFLETDLVALPGHREAAESLLDRLLKLQLARARTAHEVVSLAPGSDTLMLFRVLRADRIEFRAFQKAMSDFVNAAAFWTAKLAFTTQARIVPGPVSAQIFYP